MTAGEWSRRILLPFAATRIGLGLVGLLGLGLIGDVRSRMPGNLIAHPAAAPYLEVWARWDAEWYLLIADRGYRTAESLASFPVGYQGGDTTGFFPLYPMLIRLLSAGGLDPVAAGVLLSQAALLWALSLLYSLARDVTDEASAGAALWLLLAYPPSLFLSAVYSESLTLALILASFRSARSRRWGSLAGWGFLCSLTRPTGVLVAPALAWEVWERRGGWKGWLSLAGFAAGVVAFSAACWRWFGDPFVWIHRQVRWRGSISGPWQAFRRWAENPPQLHGAHNSLLELVVALLFLLALPFVLKTLPRSWGTHALLCVLVPLGSTLWSFGRLALMAFPVFVWAGAALRNRHSLLASALGFGFLLEGLLMTLFACGWWAG